VKKGFYLIPKELDIAILIDKNLCS